MQDELTIKQKAFADYYIETGNATEAAKRAGYSQRTAYRTGADNLKKPHVAAYIAERQKQIDDERICNIAEIQRIRTSIARWKGNIEIPAKCGITAANLLCI